MDRYKIQLKELKDLIKTKFIVCIFIFSMSIDDHEENPHQNPNLRLSLDLST